MHMLLKNRPRPWKITHHKELQYYVVRDAAGGWIVNFVYYGPSVGGSGFMRHEEALEAAQAFASLSVEDASAANSD